MRAYRWAVPADGSDRPAYEGEGAQPCRKRRRPPSTRTGTTSRCCARTPGGPPPTRGLPARRAQAPHEDPGHRLRTGDHHRRPGGPGARRACHRRRPGARRAGTGPGHRRPRADQRGLPWPTCTPWTTPTTPSAWSTPTRCSSTWATLVRALREMHRVTRPGGFIAVRDADYAAMTWYPALPGRDDWLDLARAGGPRQRRRARRRAAADGVGAGRRADGRHWPAPAPGRSPPRRNGPGGAACGRTAPSPPSTPTGPSGAATPPRKSCGRFRRPGGNGAGTRTAGSRSCTARFCAGRSLMRGFPARGTGERRQGALGTGGERSTVTRRPRLTRGEAAVRAARGPGSGPRAAGRTAPAARPSGPPAASG